MATALGHAAVRRRFTVTLARTDVLSNGCGLPGWTSSHDGELRTLIRVDLLILDDFALQARDPVDTADMYELIVERHRAASTLVTSNREPVQWIAQMTAALLAQSAIDRLQSASYELVLDGQSYRPAEARARHRQHHRRAPTTTHLIRARRGGHHHYAVAHDRPQVVPHTGGTVVPSGWRATTPSSAPQRGTRWTAG